MTSRGRSSAMSQTSPIFGMPWIVIIAFAVAVRDLAVPGHHAARPADLRHRLQPGRGAACAASGSCR